MPLLFAYDINRFSHDVAQRICNINCDKEMVRIGAKHEDDLLMTDFDSLIN